MQKQTNEINNQNESSVPSTAQLAALGGLCCVGVGALILSVCACCSQLVEHPIENGRRPIAWPSSCKAQWHVQRGNGSRSRTSVSAKLDRTICPRLAARLNWPLTPRACMMYHDLSGRPMCLSTSEESIVHARLLRSAHLKRKIVCVARPNKLDVESSLAKTTMPMTKMEKKHNNEKVSVVRRPARC
jgi:hypothetical protein